mmetsp:Transcript_58317/g.168901  ORF Transcript_58317/g.168901 Transcript_58317/m.168901 type:complete len:208 (+) Transcript_58317:351-974(+)
MPPLLQERGLQRTALVGTPPGLRTACRVRPQARGGPSPLRGSRPRSRSFRRRMSRARRRCRPTSWATGSRWRRRKFYGAKSAMARVRPPLGSTLGRRAHRRRRCGRRPWSTAALRLAAPSPTTWRSGSGLRAPTRMNSRKAFRRRCCRGRNSHTATHHRRLRLRHLGRITVRRPQGSAKAVRSRPAATPTTASPSPAASPPTMALGA